MLLSSMEAKEHLRRWVTRLLQRFRDDDGVWHRARGDAKTVALHVPAEVRERLVHEMYRHGVPSYTHTVQCAMLLGLEMLEQTPPVTGGVKRVSRRETHWGGAERAARSGSVQ